MKWTSERLSVRPNKTSNFAGEIFRVSHLQTDDHFVHRCDSRKISHIYIILVELGRWVTAGRVRTVGWQMVQLG